MSDFRDTEIYARSKGFSLDTCGSEERQYSWGLYSDFCGMSVEDAKNAASACCCGGSGSKTKNVITFLMEKASGSNEYYLSLVASYSPTAVVTASFKFDGTAKIVTIPSGQKTTITEIQASDKYKYAEITDIAISSEDESYYYSYKNEVLNGKFTLTTIKDSVTTVESVKYGTTVTITDAPAREGYDFKWKDGDGNPITASTFSMPEKDYTIIGSYVVKSYTLTYEINEQYINNNGVETRIYLTGSTSVNYGEKVKTHLQSVSVVREGYTLSSWITDTSGVVDDNTTMSSRDMSVESIYNLNQYGLKYYLDGSVYSAETYYYTQRINSIENPSKTGYTFKKWDVTIPENMPATNIETNAVFEAINYAIKYFIDSVEKTEYRENHNYGDSISIRTSGETKEGYEFSGWSPASLPSTMPAENIEVNGYFTAINYNLICYKDGESIYSTTYHFGDIIDKTVIPTPSKTGYTFDNWNPEIPNTMPSNDVITVANFIINRHVVNYYVDNVYYSAQTYNYDEIIVPLENPTKEGHTFSGWQNVPEKMGDVDIRIDGTFAINQYTLTYYVDNVVYSAETYDYNAEIIPIENPTMEGYTFSGWTETIPTRMPSHDVNIHGAFVINKYSVIYTVDGSVKYTDEYEYNSSISIRQNESKEGYTFSGWNPSSLPEKMPANNVSVVGTFTINQYTLTFLVNDSEYSAITDNYGAPINIEEPSQSGYTFSGWDKEVPSTMPAYNETFNGYLVVNVHTASYFIDGEAYTSMTYNYGETIQYPDVPKSGYTLVWEKTYLTMPDYDIIITGEYQEITVSNNVYYGNYLTNQLSGITAEDIKSLNYYDGSAEKEKSFEFTITASTECLAWAALRESAETREEYLQYQALINEWKTNHTYVVLVATPSHLEFDKLEDNIGLEMPIEVVGNYTIDDLTYTLRKYDSEGSIYQADIDVGPLTFTIKIK